MSRNVEIKARLTDITVQRKIATALAGEAGAIIIQEDIFFNVARGRLKLRILADGSGQLIFYERPNQAGPKTSNYVIYSTEHPLALRATLEAAFGIRRVVKKTRELYLSGRTRIHLDQVEGLGDFLELEVVLNDDEDHMVGEQEAHHLMHQLQISLENLVEGAYVDLFAVPRA